MQLGEIVYRDTYDCAYWSLPHTQEEHYRNRRIKIELKEYVIPYKDDKYLILNPEAPPSQWQFRRNNNTKSQHLQEQTLTDILIHGRLPISSQNNQY
ncbi:unnamed protein product [Allacma fusca]|uniref:Uncharacterized protein n=1 Tax=Allacma fusca TaxID=39272 RepID=A0A8J2KPN3_9HEXA|nr:unnamed protein product [Allacma fusca]